MTVHDRRRDRPRVNPRRLLQELLVLLCGLAGRGAPHPRSHDAHVVPPVATVLLNEASHGGDERFLRSHVLARSVPGSTIRCAPVLLPAARVVSAVIVAALTSATVADGLVAVRLLEVVTREALLCLELAPAVRAAVRRSGGSRRRPRSDRRCG